MNAEHRDNETKLQLSALMDGALERDQARFLIRRLPDDPELAGCWQRWHVAGDSLRGQGSAPLRADFVARVSLAVAEEATPGRGVPRDVLKWVGGFAVAASVALAALMAVRQPAEAPNAPANAPQVAASPTVTAPEVAPSPYREQDLRPAVRGESTMTVAAEESGPYGAVVRIDPRIESYLVRHNEATQSAGFVSYVPLVAPVRERAAVER
jgi:sigma-E factor negative regulatory protein RseA